MSHASPPPPDRVAIALAGETRTFALRVPPAVRDLPLRMPLDQPLDPGRRASRLGLVAAACVASVDGKPFSRDLRLGVQRDPGALRELFAARARLFEHYRYQGLCTLYCPHCERSGLDVDLTGLAIALGVDPWPIAEPDGTPTDPFLARLRLPAARTAAVPAARLAVARLPSILGGLTAPAATATFGAAIDAAQDTRGWKAWGRDNRPLQAHKEHWTSGNPGFRAMLRLALALSALDETRDLTPEHLEALPVTDVLFLDTLYMLLWTVPVTEPTRATLRCPVCGSDFLAVL